MTIDELRKGLQQARSEFENDLYNEGMRVGMDAAALLEDRIVTKGETATGAKLTPYSTKPGPAWWYIGRSRNKAADAEIRRLSKLHQAVSYKQFRELNNLNTNVKNLQFTGQMWQEFGVKSVQVVARGVVQVVLGGKSDRSEKLLQYHSEREKADITANSQAEIDLVTNGVLVRLKKIIEAHV